MKHTYLFPCALKSNYDGDTFDLTLDLGFGLSYEVSARLDGVDTPEISGGNEGTKALAQMAKTEVEAVCSGATLLQFQSNEYDGDKGKYGRIIGDIIADGILLSQHLLSRGLAVKYDGGSRENHFNMFEQLAKAKGLY